MYVIQEDITMSLYPTYLQVIQIAIIGIFPAMRHIRIKSFSFRIESQTDHMTSGFQILQYII